METLKKFELAQDRLRAARREAADLRELYKVATCGLTMQYEGVHYGTAGVPNHIAIRVAEMYLVWAAEYDAIASDISRELEGALSPGNEGS